MAFAEIDTRAYGVKDWVIQLYKRDAELYEEEKRKEAELWMSEKRNKSKNNDDDDYYYKREKIESELEKAGMSKTDFKEIVDAIDRGWKGIVSSLDKGIKIKQYDGYHSMTKFEINNYMNSYSTEFINKETLFNFFGPNIYDEVEGCKHYFTHEVCSSNYGIDKIYRALEAAFPFLGPNTGDLVYGENYFQTFMFNFRYLGYSKMKIDTQIMIIEALLELGFQNGLNPTYNTMDEKSTMWHYLCLGIDNFEILKHVFNYLKIKNIDFDIYFRNSMGNSFLHYLLARVSNVYDVSNDYNARGRTLCKLSNPIAGVYMMYLNRLFDEKFHEANKKVDEHNFRLVEIYLDAGGYKKIGKERLTYYSLYKYYSDAAHKDDGYASKLAELVDVIPIDMLLYRFIEKYDWLEDLHIKIIENREGVPLPPGCFELRNDFSLHGYVTLELFLNFYHMLCCDFSYNRNHVESINALKRILKKDCNVDESK